MATDEVARQDPGQHAVLMTAKGGGFVAGGQLVEYASRFVIAYLLARFLGADGYGLYTLAISVGSIFAGISALGLDDAMVRYVAILSGRRDRQGVWGTILIGLGVSTAMGVLLGVVLLVCAAPIAVGVFDEPRLLPLLRLLALIVPFLVISNVLLGTARGFGRMDYASLGENVVQSLVRIGLLALLALVGIDVFWALVIFGLSDVAASITLAVLINRRFPLRPGAHDAARYPVREVFGFAFPLWLSGLINKFRNNIEVLLLGALSTASSVGVFAVVTRINVIGHVVYSAIIVSVKPVIAQLHDRGDRAGLAVLYATASRWTLAANIPAFLAIVLYREPLLAIFGEAFTAGATALAILAVAELISAATGICGSLIDMTGHVRVKLANSVAWVTLLTASSAVLIPRWGVVGAATATLIAIAAVNIARVVEVAILERVLPFGRGFWKPVVAGAVAFGVGLLLSTWMPVGTRVLPAIAQGSVVLAVYGGLVLALGVAPEDRLVLETTSARIRSVAQRSRLASRSSRGRSG